MVYNVAFSIGELFTNRCKTIYSSLWIYEFINSFPGLCFNCSSQCSFWGFDTLNPPSFLFFITYKVQDAPEFFKKSILYFSLQNVTQTISASYTEPLLFLLFQSLHSLARSWLLWTINAHVTLGEDIDVCLNVVSWSLDCSTHCMFVQPGPIRSLHEW